MKSAQPGSAKAFSEAESTEAYAM